MDFRIANTFTDSLARLTGTEQKAVKTTAFDLQLDPSAPGLSFHRLERTKDRNFWSVRVNADIRLIVHRTESTLLLCYVDHHDDAYAWAARRRIERHPVTGAAQIVSLVERVEAEHGSPIHHPLPGVEPWDAPPLRDNPAVCTGGEPQASFLPPLFLDLSQDDLLSVGVPPDWIPEVYKASTDSVLDLADDLPEEAMEALLEYCTTGVLPRPSAASREGDQGSDPFDHPDAQRRFRVLDNVEELERALNAPWDRWTVFLHPAQRRLVERSYNGPVRVSGSAGTGKTIVALHRAVILARREPSARVALTTFSATLAAALSVKLDRLAGNEPELAARIRVASVTDLARDLHARQSAPPQIAEDGLVRSLLLEAGKAAGVKASPAFLVAEWTEVVDAWGLMSWEDYRDVARLGRKTRMGGQQRQVLWGVFDSVRAALGERGLSTWADVFARVASDTAEAPFDWVVVDEAQDIGVAEMRFLVALAGGRSERLFFAGDLGQRIFQQPFSWKSLGVDVRGRSHTLKICYRTSHQIRTQADRLLPAAVADVDGNAESRKGTISLFDGPAPQIVTFASEEEERDTVALWIAERLEDGVAPDEIAVFVRSEAELERARAAVAEAGADVLVGTMHEAKGLEFRAVVVMACDDEVIPSQERIAAVADAADLEDVYDTERHLLYVACTRARDELLVTGVDPASEFLMDMEGDGAR